MSKEPSAIGQDSACFVPALVTEATKTRSAKPSASASARHLISTPKPVAFFLVAAFALSFACAKREPVVVLDDWWNIDFAKNGCEMRAHTVNPCIGDPLLEVRDFELQFHAFFASDPLCHGIVLADYKGPEHVASKAASDADTSKGDWQLMLDFNVGRPSQGWTLVHHNQASTGQGDPKEIIHTVCGVVKQTGGSVED
jgi:hypothetical protein